MQFYLRLDFILSNAGGQTNQIQITLQVLLSRIGFFYNGMLLIRRINSCIFLSFLNNFLKI